MVVGTSGRGATESGIVRSHLPALSLTEVCFAAQEKFEYSRWRRQKRSRQHCSQDNPSHYDNTGQQRIRFPGVSTCSILGREPRDGRWSEYRQAVARSIHRRHHQHPIPTRADSVTSVINGTTLTPPSLLPYRRIRPPRRHLSLSHALVRM
jgi:hypothetical protein